MKSYYSVAFFLVLIVLSVSQSCSNKEPSPLNGSLEFAISIDSVSNPDEIIVKLVPAEPFENLNNLTVLLDDSLIATITSEPYEVSIQTSELTNGEHIITAESNSKSGDTFSSDPVTIQVNNSFNISVRYDIRNISTDYYDNYFFLTDENNELLAFEKITTETSQLIVPESLSNFNGHFVKVFIPDGSFNITSYLELDPSDLDFSSKKFSCNGDSEVTLAVTGLNTVTEIDYNIGSDFNKEVVSTNFFQTVSDNRGGACGFIYVALDNPTGYYFVKDTARDVTLVLNSQEDFNTDVSKFTVDSQDLSQVQMVGYFENDINSESVLLYRYFASLDGSRSSLNLFYPADKVFDYYAMYVGKKADNVSYYSTSFNETPTVPEFLDVTWNVKNNTLGNLDISFSGEEYSKVTYTFKAEYDGNTNLWSIHAPKGASDYNDFPPIPQEIADTYSQVDLVNFDGSTLSSMTIESQNGNESKKAVVSY